MPIQPTICSSDVYQTTEYSEKSDYDGGDHAHLFDPGCVLVAVLDGELALIGAHDLVEFAVGVLGKLLGSDLSVLDGLLHHLGLHLLEGNKLILNLVIITVASDGHALLEQVTLLGNQLAHQIHIFARHGKDRSHDVAVGPVARVIFASGQVHNLRGIEADLIFLDASLEKERLDLGLCGTDAVIQTRQVVANFLGDDGPRHFVGRHFLLGKSLDTDLAVLSCKIINTSLDEPAQRKHAQCDEGCRNNHFLFHNSVMC